MATVVVSLRSSVSSVAATSVETGGMSLMAAIAVVFPTPTGPAKISLSPWELISIPLQGQSFGNLSQQSTAGGRFVWRDHHRCLFQYLDNSESNRGIIKIDHLLHRHTARFSKRPQREWLFGEKGCQLQVFGAHMPAVEFRPHLETHRYVGGVAPEHHT